MSGNNWRHTTGHLMADSFHIIFDKVRPAVETSNESELRRIALSELYKSHIRALHIPDTNIPS